MPHELVRQALYEAVEGQGQGLTLAKQLESWLEQLMRGNTDLDDTSTRDETARRIEAVLEATDVADQVRLDLERGDE